MKNLDILQASDGSQLRVILYAEPQSYVVDCQRFRMPALIRNADLAAMQTVSADRYASFVLDDDLSPRQREQRNKRFSLLDGLLCSQAITDKAYRSRIAQEQATLAGVTRRTVLLYLWRYWVHQNKNALLTSSGTERSNDLPSTLSADDKNIRWALNKYYYTPQKQTLTTAYKMMLQARYCDAYGKLLPQYPSFWQFRYYFRCHRDPINETISRQGQGIPAQSSCIYRLCEGIRRDYRHIHDRCHCCGHLHRQPHHPQAHRSPHHIHDGRRI